METPAEATGVKARQWWRNAAGMTTVVFIAFFGFNFVIPLLPLFAQLLGVTGTGQTALLGGVLFAIAPLLSAFSSPVWGVVADRYGRKRMVQRALAVSVGAYTLMAMATSIWHVVALRAVIGIFGGFYSMSLAYLMAVTPASKASIAIGLLQGAQIGGTIAGPAIAGYVADAYGLRASFYAGAVVVAIGFTSLAVLAQDDRDIVARHPGEAATRAPVKDDVADVSGALRRAWRGATGGLSDLGAVIHLPGFLPILGALLLAQMVDRSYGPILPLYVRDLGAAENEVASFSGLIVSLSAAAMGLSAGASGLVASRWRPDWLLVASLVAGAALCAPMALVETPTQFLVVRVLLGLFAGGTVTLVMSLANTRIPSASKGAAFGVISSATLLGTAVSPLVTGALAGIDLRLVFVLNSMLYLVALVGVVRQVMRPAPVSASAVRIDPHGR
jgi:DHA1 family multidrug resistance protein-like MFS transporter